MAKNPIEEAKFKSKIRRSIIYYSAAVVLLTLAYVGLDINSLVYWILVGILVVCSVFSFIGFRTMKAELNQDKETPKSNKSIQSEEQYPPQEELDLPVKGEKQMSDDIDYLEVKHHLLCLSIGKAVTEGKEIYDAARYAWRLNVENAQKAEFIVAHQNNKVIGVFRADEWLPADDPEFQGLSDSIDPARWGFIGSVAPSEILAMYFGKNMPENFSKRGASNPVRFLTPEGRECNDKDKDGGKVDTDMETEAVKKNVVLFYPEGFNNEFDGLSGLSEEDLSNFVDGAAYEMSTIISEYMDDSVKSVHIIKWNKSVVSSSIEIMDIGTEDPLVFFQDNDIGEPISLIVEHNDEDWNYSFLKISESANASFWVIGLDEKGDVISNEYESGEYIDGYNVEGDEYKNMGRNVEIFNKI